MHRDRLVEIAVAHQIEQWTERLVLYDFKLVLRGRETRPHVTAAPVVELLAAEQNLAALAFHALDRLLHVLNRRGINQRTDERVAIERIADAHRFVCA